LRPTRRPAENSTPAANLEFFIMAAQTELESYTELAEHCLWEAERTLDREVAHSLRALGERYRRMSERSRRQDAYR
jgi:hypothetical protein